LKREDKDRAYLWDILSAAEDIHGFVDGVSLMEFENDKKCRFAVERQLLVIGEAAHHLSSELTDAHPDIPWSQMVGLRNIIVHDYGEILTERVWTVTQKHIPMLIWKMSALLEEFPEE
jgi:uncharacterized protein with HEPN domain